MTNEKKNSIFSFLYCNRVKVSKDSTPILNLSLVFCILAVITAPWLVVGGVIVALVLGYKFGYERNAAGFSSDFEAMIKGAASNVRKVVDNVTDKFDGDNDNDTPTDAE
jgi:hypothetical protein